MGDCVGVCELVGVPVGVFVALAVPVCTEEPVAKVDFELSAEAVVDAVDKPEKLELIEGFAVLEMRCVKLVSVLGVRVDVAIGDAD